MSTVIDSLIVRLGLDPTDFKKGTKDAAESQDHLAKVSEKNSKEMKNHNHEVAESFSKIKEELLSITAVLLGGYGIEEFTKHAVESDAAIGRLSNTVGVATDELAAWGSVAEKLGSSSKDAEDAFRNISQTVEGLKHGQWSESFNWLAMAGLDLQKYTGPDTSNLERMRMLAEAFHKLKPEEAQFFGQKAGLSESFINALMHGNDELDKLIKHQKELNLVTKNQTKDADDLEQAWHDVTQAASGTARKILYDVAPAARVAFGAIEEMLNYAQKHLGSTEVAAGGLALTFAGIAAITFSPVLLGIGKLVPALAEASTGAAALLALVGRVTGALGLAATAGVATGYAMNWIFEKSVGTPFGAWLFNLFHKDENQEGLDSQSRHSSGHIGGLPQPGASTGGPTASQQAYMADLENKYGLMPGLLSGVYHTESADGTQLLSPKGAKGPFGFMDDTAKQYGVKDPYDFEQSANGAAKYLHFLMGHYNGDTVKALSAYNWGEGNEDRKGLGRAPAETRNYPGKVLSSINRGGANTVNGGDTNSIHIDKVEVVSSAHNPQEFARDFVQGVNDYAFATQANGGPH